MANSAEPHRELTWNAQAQTRRDWGNVSHILETMARNGGEREVAAVLSAPPGPNNGLKEFETRAAEVFGRTAHVREDLRDDNWQMAHVAANAARRLQRYLQSGHRSSRSFIEKPELRT